MSFTQNIQHIVFATKNRESVIPEAHERELYQLLFSLLKNKGCFVYRIGGMPDHVHILADIPSTISLAELLKYIKSTSSKFLLENDNFTLWRGWGESYCSLSKSADDIVTVKQYISNQKEHHKTISSLSEYQAMVMSLGVSPDDKYFPR